MWAPPARDGGETIIIVLGFADDHLDSFADAVSDGPPLALCDLAKALIGNFFDLDLRPHHASSL